MAELCITQEKFSLDSRRETPHTKIEELSEILKGAELTDIEFSDTYRELMNLLENTNTLEALRIQDSVFAIRFNALEKRYDVRRKVNVARSLIYKGCVESDSLTDEEIKQLSPDPKEGLIFLSKTDIAKLFESYHKSLQEYFMETKKIGLGLSDRDSMRIGRTLYSILFFLNETGIRSD